jgi:hypothetical protein
MSARPPIPQPPYKGGCLCGAVRYRLDARPLAINACYCSDCQKLTGATNLLMVLAPRDAFTQEQGTVQRYRKRADSGREVDIVRCKDCGVRMWHEPLASPNMVFIAAGTLDAPGWCVPTSHIWIEKALPGVVLNDDAIAIEGQPADRQMLFDAFVRIYGSA